MNLLSGIMKRLTRRYRTMSIQMVISISFITVTVVGMVFMGLTLVLSFSSASAQTSVDNSQRILSQINMNLDSYLRRMMHISDAAYYRGIKNVDFAHGDIADALSILYSENRDSLVSIALFDSAGSLVSSTPLTVLKSDVNPAGEQWFRLALDKMENFHFSTPHVQNLFQNPDYPFRWVITLSRQAEITRHGVTENGVLLVDMSYGWIEQIFRETDLSDNGYLYLMDRRGELIYHPQQQLIYAGIERENNELAAGYGDGVHRESFEGSSRRVMIKTVGYTGWKLVGVLPAEGLVSDSRQLLLSSIFLLLFSVFLVVFLNLRISAYISDPIRKLEQGIKQLEAGGEAVALDLGGCYEVERLSRAINSMVSTMRHLMDDIIQQEAEKRRSELEILQSQINPHFLYNTLDSVIWMTEAGHYREAIQMVTSLGRLFRISLSKGQSIIPLSEELAHVRHYLTIQALRYKNRFVTQVTAEENTESLFVLKLIVQPLLENAIYHGLALRDEDGLISVHAYRQDGDLMIDVKDNGIGMPPEVVAALLDESRASASSGIGIRNVHRRIALTFGEGDGLTVSSEPDEGTLVRIRLPVLNGREALARNEVSP